MKKVYCDICGRTIKISGMGESYYKLKVRYTNEYVSANNFNSHICNLCLDRLIDFLNRKEE